MCLRFLVLGLLTVYVAAQIPLFDNGAGRLDPIAARRFQEANGLPEDPNSVFPAQALVRPAVIPSGPANRVATPIMEDNSEGASLSGVPFSGVPLSGVPLNGAPLSGPPLSGSPLGGTPLSDGSPLVGSPPFVIG